MKEKLWKVTVEDLSNLGGPMGTEYTTVIETKWFKTIDGAMEWVKKDAKKRKAMTSDFKFYKNEKNHKSLDLGNIGYLFDYENFEIGN